MQSQKITRSTARHLRRKRMNLARKAEKLSESSEGSLIINDIKCIKNSINLQIIESLDAEKGTKSSESSTAISNSTTNSVQYKNVANCLTNNTDKKEDSCGSRSVFDINSTQDHLNVHEKNLQTRDDKKEKTPKPLKLAKVAVAPIAGNKNADMLENEKPIEMNHVNRKESEIKVEMQENSKVGKKNMTKNKNENTMDVPKTESNEGKSKAQMRAERRAIQEAQRALKAQLKGKKELENKPVQPKKEKKEEKPVAQTLPAKVEKSASPTKTTPPETNSEKKVVKKVVESHVMGVFDHLVRDNSSQVTGCLNTEVHPTIFKLGLKYAEGKATGSDCRCVALLLALKRFIKDFQAPEQQDFLRGLEAALNKVVEFLDNCRPISATMHNALKRLRWEMSSMKSTETDEKVKTDLISSIDTYIHNQIILAGEAISRKMLNRINDGDVILTYGYSSLVTKILCDAHEKEKKFRVIIVDSRPRLEGKAMLKKLVKHNIDCTYVLISALSFVMPQVSFILLGAHSILANGSIMARVGTAQVALMGKDFGVPVLVASEMNKSDDSALTDSFVYNELDNSDELTKTFDDTKKSPLNNWKSRKSLNLLNLAYDVTPASFITSVITELAIVPCSSIPVVLRVKPWEI